MTEPEQSPRTLPGHIESTIQAIADMQARHRRSATPSQRAFAVMAGIVAKPRFLGVLTLAIVLWTGGNLLAGRLGLQPWDPPPFYWLEVAVSLSALYTTVIILIAQKREDELSALREQLTLELVILGEQKSAKAIELLERLRRDLPSVPNPSDPEASAMSKPADPMSVADALMENQEAEMLDEIESLSPDKRT